MKFIKKIGFTSVVVECPSFSFRGLSCLGASSYLGPINSGNIQNKAKYTMLGSISSKMYFYKNSYSQLPTYIIDFLHNLNRQITQSYTAETSTSKVLVSGSANTVM